MVFFFVINSNRLASCKYLQLQGQSVVDKREFLSWELMYGIMAWCLLIWYFLKSFFCQSRCIFASEYSSSFSNFFSCYLFIQYFNVLSVAKIFPKMVLFLLLICSNNWHNFLSLFWKVLFYLYCLTQSRCILSLPSQANIQPRWLRQ